MTTTTICHVCNKEMKEKPWMIVQQNEEMYYGGSYLWCRSFKECVSNDYW